MLRLAEVLRELHLDFEAHGLCWAAALLAQSPLPRLARLHLLNVDAQHLEALHSLPALRHLHLARPPGGLFAHTPGPAAETLVARLAGLRLESLSVRWGALLLHTAPAAHRAHAGGARAALW